MTLQRIYSTTSNITPQINIISDDSKFEYLFEIPVDQTNINVSLENSVYILDNSTSNTVCVKPQTTTLSGVLNLTSTNLTIEHNSNVHTVYYAGYNTNSIIFEYTSPYSVNMNVLNIGDTVNGNIVTKVVNWFEHLCYAEFGTITSNFVQDAIYSVRNNEINIKVKSGYGIIRRAGLIGKFSTKFKEIYYFAKFKNQNTVISNTKTVDFKDFPLNLNLVELSTPKDSRWNTIHTDTINPSQTNQSEISNIPSATFESINSNLDGTSNLENSIKINTFFDIPTKTSELSYGISNYQPIDNRTDLLGPIELPIIVNFTRQYSGIPITSNISNNNSTIIDNWLLHEWSTGFISTGTGQNQTCTTPDYTEPTINYIKDNDGYINKISALQGSGNNRKEHVLFANNDLLIKTGTHELNYTYEPYNSSNVTEYRGIQSKYILDCIYRFSVDKLTSVNSTGSNLEYPTTTEIRLTAEFNRQDAVIHVNSTDGFMQSGYLAIPIYKINLLNNSSNAEMRNYEYIGNKLITYTHKTNTKFLGITHVNYINVDVTKLNTTEFLYPYPIINQYFLF